MVTGNGNGTGRPERDGEQPTGLNTGKTRYRPRKALFPLLAYLDKALMAKRFQKG